VIVIITLSLERFNILLKSDCYYYFITGKILKLFDKVSEKFDFIRN